MLHLAPAAGAPRKKFVACAFSLVGSTAVLAALGPCAERMAGAQVAWGVGSVAWLAACALVGRGAGSLRGIVAVAVVLRVVAFAGTPRLSDDLPRYVWEGALVAEGVSPYAWAPSAPELAEQRARWPDVHARINHPAVSAAYPPLAQLALAAGVAAAGGADGDPRDAELALRGLFALCDLGVVLALAACLRAWGRDPRLAVAWAWCPLAVQEFSGVGHFDSLGILLLVLGLLAWKRGAGARAAAILAAGALVKLLPAAPLPWVLRGGGARRLLAAGATLVAGTAWVLLLAGGPRGILAGLGEYGLRWESTSLLYRFVEPLVERLVPDGARRDGGPRDPRVLGRAAVASLLAGLALREWLRRSDPARAARVLVRGFVLLTPTLHPWYVAWSVPFLALSWSTAWAVLVGLAPLLYWPLARWQAAGLWEEPPWLWPAVALPFLALLARESLQPRSGAR